jgi:hypothetical protein
MKIVDVEGKKIKLQIWYTHTPLKERRATYLFCSLMICATGILLAKNAFVPSQQVGIIVYLLH